MESGNVGEIERESERGREVGEELESGRERERERAREIETGGYVSSPEKRCRALSYCNMRAWCKSVPSDAGLDGELIVSTPKSDRFAPNP